MTKKQKRTLYRILASGLLFLLGLLLPLEGVGKLLILLPAYAIIGWDVLWKAARNIINGQVFDENFLMALATVGAFFTGEYPEAVAVMLFYQTGEKYAGELFQSVAVGRSRRSIAALMDIRPDYANIEENGLLRQVDPEEVVVGDTIVVKAGEHIPLDGVVLEGNSSLDTAALTGESLPRAVAPGDPVISGCINQSGLLRVRATKVYGESTVARILDLVENASTKKAKVENFITRFARYYTPVVVVAAVLLAVLSPLLTSVSWQEGVHRALIFLVISCPCALVISVPLSFFGGIGGESKIGVLVKGSSYLEALADTQVVVFDKTGTLTKGVFQVTAIHPQGMEEAELLELCALADSYSEHPISHSLRKELDATRLGAVEELSGRGIQAVVDGKTVLAGNQKLMAERGIPWEDCERTGTIVHLAVEGSYAGHIVISDEVKPEASGAIAALRAGGVKKTVMLTGDAKEVGEAVARELGLDEVHSQLLPGDKVEQVERLLEETSRSGKLAFVGDGINDAPVLSRADVGIAMGGLGSDAAIEAADVVLMDDAIEKLPAAIAIARRTLSIARQNIIFALVVKGAVLLLGAWGMANMWEAVFADVGVSVLAILNAMRALKVEK